jgi:hypothetical protein
MNWLEVPKKQHHLSNYKLIYGYKEGWIRTYRHKQGCQHFTQVLKKDSTGFQHGRNGYDL